ncbi:Do family serine endopeptidase [Desulfococcaceae bacterium HSG9]|nr:Do family serine endopeptidase [Desulfococcaceae bacterium HSG9]
MSFRNPFKFNPISKTRFIIYTVMVLSVTGLLGYPASDYQTAWASPRMIPENFSTLVTKSSPAVVNIRTEKDSKTDSRVFRFFHQNPFGDDDPFREFHEKFFGGRPNRDFKQRSLGSGFIIDKEGYIVTNNHVVEDADKIKVILTNSKEYDAKIIGRDPNTDLALIKIKAETALPAVELGDSDKLQIGEWVIAIGSPFGLEHTVTAGIISAKGRVIGSGPYDDFLQTDASINPGNSGGPLIDMNAKVVGINTAIIAGGGGGIGFAIPINLAKGIIEQLRTKGEVSRGWLGVAIQDVSKEMSEYYGLKDRKGALVAEIFEDNPAAKAGILPHDLIMEVDGKKIESSRDLTRVIAESGVGNSVEIKVFRNGEQKTFKVELAQRKKAKNAPENEKADHKDYEGELGMQVTKITPKIARRFKMQETTGVVVTHVEPNSKADNAEIMRGDLIREINHRAINAVSDFVEVLRGVKKGEEVFLVISRLNKGTVVIKLIK